MNYYYIRDLNEMVGQTFTKVYTDGISITFENSDVRYIFYHNQDCCEDVRVEDIVGELSDLENWPLLVAYEASSENYPPPVNGAESYTWTFYNFATYKGYVTIRFLGTSNGYYSESVSCRKEVLKSDIDMYH